MTDRAVVTWAEMQIPGAPGIRRAVITFAEMEVPDAPARTQVSWAEMEVPDAPGVPTASASVRWFKEAAQAMSGVALVDEYHPIHPYLQAAAVAFENLAAQGEPLTGAGSGNVNAVPKFVNATRMVNSTISDSGTVVTIAAELIVTGPHIRSSGSVRSSTAGDEAILVAGAGSGHSPVIILRVGNVQRAIMGTAGTAGDLVAGSAQHDLVIRSDGGSIRFSPDAGASDILKIDANFVESRVPFVINGLILIRPRKPGYSPMAGTADRGSSFNTATVTLAQLAQRVKAMQDDLTGHHGLFGA